MTLNGAIMQLIEMRENSMMPVVFKPYFDKVIETISECVEPSEIPHWIPCNEGLPRTNGVYNVTRKISDGFECRNISDSCYYDGANTWHDDTRVNHERKYLTDVIAWMPLSEPYREDGEQE